MVPNLVFCDEESFGRSVLCDDVGENCVIVKVFFVCDQG